MNGANECYPQPPLKEIIYFYLFYMIDQFLGGGSIPYLAKQNFDAVINRPSHYYGLIRK